MQPKLITEESLKNRVHIFEDRHDAGRKLASKLQSHRNTDSLVLAIPSGGVPVAFEIARLLNLPMDLILVRKVQIPWNTEAGFGAVNLDGEVILNEDLLEILNLSKEEIALQIKKTTDLLKQRNQLFRDNKPFPDIGNKVIILVDDGLASGFTLRAALRFVRQRGPQRVVVAVPTGSSRTVENILKHVDEVICLNLRSGLSFAVADAYAYWYDLTDEDVLSILRA